MKFCIGLLVTVWALSACQESKTVQKVTKRNEPANACTFVVESDDSHIMRFNVQEIPVKASCAQFKVTLKHVLEADGAHSHSHQHGHSHNIVISKQEDKLDVIQDGIRAGANQGFVKVGDRRVIASTKMIGGGETADLVLTPSKLDKSQAYEFYCTFPGHAVTMLGAVKLVN